MKCPRCSNVLKTTVLDGIQVDNCPVCGGSWYDNDELRQAKDLGEPDAIWMDFNIWKHEERFKLSQDSVLCPRCAKPLCLAAYHDTGVQLDVCPSCRGIWVDEGELRHILEALDTEMNQKTFAEYVPETIKEAIEIVTGPESLVSEWRDFKQVLRLMYVRFFVEKPGLLTTLFSVQSSSPIR